jgi:hypothetical protein
MSRATVRRTCLALAALALAAALSIAVSAQAEQSARGGVRVAFRGSFSPSSIPRHRLAPISLTLEGSARGEDGPPPRLQQITFAFGARGGLETEGLPACPRARLRNATSRQALARCGDALVGDGEITAEVPLNPEQPIAVVARVLVFNGRFRGRPAAWVHAYSATPPASFVLPFYLARPAKGTYGVLMRSPVGRSLGRWPRLRSFRITLGRRYRAGGEVRSYLSAHCPLAPSLTRLSVPFARATYEFAPHPTIVQPIRRLCAVSE